MNLLIIVAGLGAFFGVEVRELPDIDRPIVTVRAELPGGSPETIDAEVTSVIEGAVARVNGVVEVRSSSEENNFRMRAFFRPSVDLIAAANDVREAVSRVERHLPHGIENLFVVKADADAYAVVRLAVSSETLSIDALTRQIENDVIPELTAIEGVADVNVFGERKRVLRVVIDPLRLAGYKLSVADVVKVLQSADFDIPAGSFKSDEQEVLVRANTSVTKPSAIEQLVIRDPVRIKDIGHVFFSPDDPESIVRHNGRNVISLGVVRRAQSNTVQISGDIGRAVERLNTRLKTLNIAVTQDDAIFIRGAITEVLISLSLAVLIVVVVIALFIGQLRAALIPAVAIPVALIGTVAAIWLLGFSLNLITLLALVLATGLVVDDAIVVLENIQRRRQEGLLPRAAAVVGTRQVFFAVIATTATLISVFAPISFLPSQAGRLFSEFGFVLAVAVCISSFVALTAVPMMASRLRQAPKATGGPPSSLLAKTYAALLGRILAAPLVVLGLCCLVIVGALIAYEQLGEELVPEEDRGLITVRLTGPDGTGLDYTDRQVEKVEAILQPFVDEGTAKGLFTITGRYDPNRGQIDAPLVNWAERSKSESDIAKAANKKLAQIPGARARVRRGNSLGLRNADGGIRFALTGSEYETIAGAADAFVLALEKNVPQVQNLRVEFRATQPQIIISIDRRRATDLGVPIEALGTTLKTLVDKSEVAELSINDERVPVILQATAGAIDDPSDLTTLYVTSSAGRLVPLSQLVTFKEYAVAAELDRHGQRRAVEIFGDGVDGYSLREAVDAVQAEADKSLPPGIGLLFLDEAAALNETSYGVQITYLIAMVIVFLVLVAQFESITSALVVLLTVPFGVCAAIFALTFTGTSINIYSQIGILMLIGIMAKNAILMVEFADQLREKGHAVVDAVREASIVRLRPIAMTMVSTVLAGLPLILGSGPGAEARSAIGWVVFGGLGMAGLFTLLVTPAFYVLIAPLSTPRARAGEQLEDELRGAQTPAE
ncbi:MAG: efflux RND transporter permease subunit [Alphaproteobacteria bacterium]|nr:efflux RND transporter permease subunit [Alphaproteobacteria bacterium]